MEDPQPLPKPSAQTRTPSVERLCRYCCSPIVLTAKVCKSCGRHQNPFWQHFRIEQAGLLVSLIMMAIAFSQLREARSQRIAAAEAVARAERAETRVVGLNEALREQFLLVASLTWLQLETRNEFGTPRSQAAIQEMLKES